MLYSCVTSLHNPEVHLPQSSKPSFPANRCASATITGAANIIKTKHLTFCLALQPSHFHNDPQTYAWPRQQFPKIQYGPTTAVTLTESVCYT
jgi:hypothetical protein